MSWVMILAAITGMEEKDSIKELVMGFLASYAGMALGISLLIELLKMIWGYWIKPRTPQLTIIFTFIFGSAAKCLLPDVYGPHTYKSWTMHILILVFVAVIAAVFHDKFWNAIKGKLGGIIPGLDTEEKPPKPPGEAGGGASGGSGGEAEK